MKWWEVKGYKWDLLSLHHDNKSKESISSKVYWSVNIQGISVEPYYKYYEHREFIKIT